MKTPITTFLLIMLSITAFSQKTKVINNPSFEFTNSGIYEVSKIELSKTETRLYIHSVFIQNWWVMYSEKDCIYLHETGDTLSPTKIIGSEFGAKLWMPASGDSTIIMVYPPIDKNVKTINWFTQDDNQTIYGISLDPNKKHLKKDNSVPQEVEDWFEKELSAYADKKPMNIMHDDILNGGKAKLIGYIKGYNKLAGFSTGMIYLGNEFTRENFPTVATIEPDGRFEATLNIFHPIETSIIINDKAIKIYLEPGQITGLTLDWNEFLTADRLRNIRYKFKDIQYHGPLAKTNKDLSLFETEPWDYRAVTKKIKVLSPEAYINFEEEWKTKSLDNLNSYKTKQNISESTYKILHNDILLNYGTHLFDYTNNRTYEAKKDTANKNLTMPLPANYYAFLSELPLNDPSIVINNEFSTFINRFEYMAPISHKEVSKYVKKQAIKINTFKTLKDNNASLNNKEWELIQLTNKEDKTDEEKELLKANNDIIKGIFNKHQALFQKQYFNQMALSAKHDWIIKDSLIDNTTTNNAQFVKDVIKVRTFNGFCQRFETQTANRMWNDIKPLIKNPSVSAQGDQLLSRMFPIEKVEYFALAEGKGKEIFTNLIAPFKGKVLFIDFWATSCGPCVGGIKRMKETREKYKDSPNIEFIFITDERSSPETTYNTFVAEQELKHTYRISKDDYLYLRELFQFNGIPRYALVDPNGNVLDNNFSMYNFKPELQKRFPEFVIED